MSSCLMAILASVEVLGNKPKQVQKVIYTHTLFIASDYVIPMNKKQGLKTQKKFLKVPLRDFFYGGDGYCYDFSPYGLSSQ